MCDASVLCFLLCSKQWRYPHCRLISIQCPELVVSQLLVTLSVHIEYAVNNAWVRIARTETC